MIAPLAIPDLTPAAALTLVDEAVSQSLRQLTASPQVQGAVAAARAFTAALVELDRLEPQVEAIAARLNEAMPDNPHRSFSLAIITYWHGRPTSTGQLLRSVIHRTAWAWVLNHLGVRKLMSYAQRKELDQQVENGDLPELDENTVIGFILSLADRAKTFAATAVQEVFDFVRLASGHYKTNNVFRIGERAILQFILEEPYARQWRVSYGREGELGQLEAVFRLLDGRAILTEGTRTPIVTAINNAPVTTKEIETEYLAVKPFRNRNLHIRFKRMDLVAVVNALGGQGRNELDK